MMLIWVLLDNKMWVLRFGYWITKSRFQDLGVVEWRRVFSVDDGNHGVQRIFGKNKSIYILLKAEELHLLLLCSC